MNPPAAVAGLSVTYFIVAGVFEAYALHPLLMFILTKTTKEGLQSLSVNDIKATDREVYWFIVIFGYTILTYLFIRRKSTHRE